MFVNYLDRNFKEDYDEIDEEIDEDINYEIERLKTLVETNEKYHKLELKNKDLKIENLELKLLTCNIK